MRKFWLFSLFLLQVGGAVLVGETFETQVISSSDNDKLVRFSLDGSVYQHLDENYKNISVVDSDNKPVPYLLRRVTSVEEVCRIRSVASNIESFSYKKSGGSLVISLKKGSNEAVEGFDFAIDQRDFENRVTVFASDDAVNWKELVRDRPIFDYSAHANFRHLSVKITASKSKFFRFDFDRMSQEDEKAMRQVVNERYNDGKSMDKISRTLQRKNIRINAVTAKISYVEKKKVPKIRTYPVKVEKSGAGQWEIDTANFPLDSIKITANSDNFIRRVSLRKQDSQWSIAEGEISRLTMGGFNQEKNWLKFPEIHEKGLQFTQVENGEPCEDLGQIQAFGPEYELLFLQRPNKHYAIRYGENVAGGRSDGSDLLHKLLTSEQKLHTVTLSEAVIKKMPLKSVVSGFWSSKIVLNIILIVGVIVLTVFLKRSISTLDQTDFSND